MNTYYFSTELTYDSLNLFQHHRYDFIYFGIYGENNKEIFRKDLNDKDISNLLVNGVINHSFMFDSNTIPTYYIIWLHNEKDGWLERFDYPIFEKIKEINNIFDNLYTYNFIFKNTRLENIPINLIHLHNLNKGTYFHHNKKFYINLWFDPSKYLYGKDHNAIVQSYLHEICHAIETFNRNPNYLLKRDFNLPVFTPNTVQLTEFEIEAEVVTMQRVFLKEMRVPFFHTYNEILSKDYDLYRNIVPNIKEQLPNNYISELKKKYITKYNSHRQELFTRYENMVQYLNKAA